MKTPCCERDNDGDGNCDIHSAPGVLRRPPVQTQKPSIGRIVHYHAYGTPGGEFKPEPRAAVITEVIDDLSVSLCVLNPTGMFFNRNLPFSEVPKPGHWNWPPRI